MDGNELIAKLRDLGIRQEGDPVLRQQCQPLDLPTERAEAVALWDHLRRYVDQLQGIYPFTKGVGLAAPQIGIPRAMSVVRSPDGADDIALINPVVVWQSDEQDEKYEGCLSFFDVRVPVHRPLAIRVHVTTLDGERSEHAHNRGLARLVLHEIDHLRAPLPETSSGPEPGWSFSPNTTTEAGSGSTNQLIVRAKLSLPRQDRSGSHMSRH